MKLCEFLQNILLEITFLMAFLQSRFIFPLGFFAIPIILLQFLKLATFSYFVNLSLTSFETAWSFPVRKKI